MEKMGKHDSRCQGFIYGVLQNPTILPASGCAMVALVAAHPFAGTTYNATLLNQSLNQNVAGSSTVLNYRSDDQLAPATVSTTRSRTLPGLNANGSWRSSREGRTAYLTKLRHEYSNVLVDCPCLKETTEVLALMSLVDGVCLVIEAEKTTKSQIAYLERSIESAGGNILGHILNKRTYPIPAWAYKKLAV